MKKKKSNKHHKVLVGISSRYVLRDCLRFTSSVHHTDKKDTPSRHLGVDDIPARKELYIHVKRRQRWHKTLALNGKRLKTIPRRMGAKFTPHYLSQTQCVQWQLLSVLRRAHRRMTETVGFSFKMPIKMVHVVTQPPCHSICPVRDGYKECKINESILL